MHSLSDTYRAFAQFEVFRARNGMPSALHCPSGILLHSRIDPAAEAMDVAQANLRQDSVATVIIGGGLGYLPEAVSRLKGRSHPIWILEFDAAVHALGRQARPDADYYTSDSIRVICSATTSALMRNVSAIPDDADVMVAPYLLRLIEHEKYPLSDLLHIMRAEQASKEIYDPLLAAHAAQTRDLRGGLQSVRSFKLPAGKMIVVVGAGPSLDSCLSLIRERREEIVLVAASGAVPALQTGHIEPDWVIALEAKDEVVDDLKSLTAQSTVVVFPSTHPAVFHGKTVRYLNGGSETDGILETRGGSSVIPALSLALQNSNEPVLVIGVDLGNHNGLYARSARRQRNAEPLVKYDPPKYASMRAGLERVIANSKSAEGRVFHVLEEGIPLRGSVRLTPRDLPQHFETFLNAN